MRLKKHLSYLLAILLTISTAIIPIGLKVQADTDSVTILESNFDDGTQQGWVAKGGGTTLLSISADQHHSGNSSLKVNPRADGQSWNGPDYNLAGKLVDGQKYTISAWAYNGDTAKHDIKITVNNATGANEYSQVASQTAQAGTWVQLSGSFTYTSATTGAPNVYFESPDTAFSFYVDDVLMTGPKSGGNNAGSAVTKPSAPASGGASYDFEDGTVQNWSARGGAVSNVADEKHSGAHSLKISGRKLTWHGPIVDITDKVQKGATYHVSAWVKYNDGPASKSFSLQTQITDSSDKDSYATVTSATLTKGQWQKLENDYVVPSDYKKLCLYLETQYKSDAEVKAEDIMDFYVDDVKISVPGVIAQADFEDGTTGNMNPRGSVTLAVDKKAFHNGAASLNISGRTANWNGPEYDMLGKMENGKTYLLSAWVYQTSGSEQKITMSMDRKDADQHYDSIAYQKTVPSNTWTELKGEYTLNSTGTLSKLGLYFESPNETLSFNVDDFIVTDNSSAASIEKDIPALWQQYSKYFKIGTAVNGPELASGSLSAQLIAKHFNLITPGNEMKIDATEPSEGKFNFVDGDKFTDFAKANNMQVRGHNLVWHSQVPDWMFLKDPKGSKYDPSNFCDKETLLARMKNHIDNVMGHYKDMKLADGRKLVIDWDVVNEVIDPASKDPDKIRDKDNSGQVNRWYAIAGTDFIEQSFKDARAADPSAKLYYNDYGTEDSTKRDAIFKLVKKLKDKGLIDGVGLQAHIDMTDPTLANFEKTVKMFTDIGVDVKITELDITLKNANPSNELLVKQAYRYKAIYDMLKKYANQSNGKGSVNGVTVWGLTDDKSWLGADAYPLLFDKNFKAKPAYWALVDPSKVPANVNDADSAKGSIIITSSENDSELDLAKQYNISDISGQNIASFKTMWDSKYLYVYGKVNDSTFGKNDSVEIFIDQNNNKSAKMESDNRSLYIDCQNSKKNVLKTWNGTKFVSAAKPDFASVVKTISGYNFKGQIPLDAVNPAVGGKIGFDIRINNGGAVASWNDQQNSQLSNPSRYGVLTLVNPPNVSEAKYGTPTMDVNNLDSLWNNANVIETNVKVNDSSKAMNTGKAKIRTLWDKDYLYVLAEVNDPSLSDKSANAWEQDSLEIFVDEDNAKGISYDENDSQQRINFKNVLTSNPDSSSKKVTSLTKVIYDAKNPKLVKGYIVEARIKFNNPMASGIAIGFDAQVNDDKDGNGTRDSVYLWNDPSGNSYKDMSGLGVLRLGSTSASN